MRIVPFIAVPALGISVLSLSVLGALFCIGGCASPSAQSVPIQGQAAEVRFYDSRTQLEMAIVNDSHLERLGVEGTSLQNRRLTFYSEVRGDTGPKVTTDEMLGALIGYLDKQGFERLSTAGSLPSSDLGSISIEITTGPVTRHAYRKKGMSLEDAKSFNELVMAFYQTYNAISQFQAYDGAPGEVFRSPEGPADASSGKN
jgi:hypothetical protein